jgi:type IV secretion system protein VirD4
VKGFAVAFAVLVGAQYLAGCLFLWSVRARPQDATPLTIARYGYYYGERAQVRSRLIASSAGGLALVLASGLALLLPRRRALHGDARFATRREIRGAGLLGEHGIILGRIGKHCLMLSGQQGVALAAPPRAGKGTGVVVPNALNWPGSLVCIDIKRENWTLTAGFRERAGQACFR